jgi:hypothetical protein
VLHFCLQSLVPAVGLQVVAEWRARKQQQKRLCDGNGDACGAMEHKEGDEAAAMEVDEEGGACAEEGEEEGKGGEEGGEEDDAFPTLLSAAAQFDDGEAFEGSFSAVAAETTSASASAVVAGAGDGRASEPTGEAYTKQVLQLLSQVCLVEPRMLAAFMHAYTAWRGSSISGTSGTSGSSTGAEAAVGAGASDAGGVGGVGASEVVGAAAEKSQEAEVSGEAAAPGKICKMHSFR